MIKNIENYKQGNNLDRDWFEISVIMKYVFRLLVACILVISLMFTVLFFDIPSHKKLAFAEDENSIKSQQTPDTSFIYDTPISDLAEATVYYDKKTVQVEGEVIGDRIEDEDEPDYCWITLTSLDLNTHTLGVYMKKSDAEVIDTYGAYGKTGTRLRVRGTFYLACEQHSGISGLHATNVTATEKGSTTQADVNIWICIAGVVAVLIGVVLMIVYRHVRGDDE